MGEGELAARGPEMTKILRFVRASALQHYVAALPPQVDRASVMRDACNHEQSGDHALMPLLLKRYHEIWFRFLASIDVHC